MEYGLEIRGPWAPSYEDPYYFNEEWRKLIKESGAKWARVHLYGVHSSDLRGYFGTQMDAIHSLGMKVLLCIDNVGLKDIGSLFTLEDWDNYVSKFIINLGNRVDAIEIWGEPDNSKYYLGYMDGTPQHYFDMLKIAYDRIKSVEPKVSVIAPAVMTVLESYEIPWQPIGGADFLRQIFDLGAENYCDYVSIHTYGIGGQTPKQAIEKTQTIIRGSKKIWVTELGYKGTQEDQVLWMNENFNLINQSIPNPDTIFWYMFMDDQNGIINMDFSKRLSYDVFKNYATPKFPIDRNIIFKCVGPIGLGLYLIRKTIDRRG